MKRLLTIGLLAFWGLGSSVVCAWDGYDYDAGSFVEIERGNRVRRGENIEIYDYDDGEYHDFDVESVHRHGGSVEVDGHDNDTDEDRTLDMDD